MSTETPSRLLRTFGLRRPRRQAAVLRHRARRAVEILRHEGPLSLIARMAALAGYRRALVMSTTLDPPPPLVEPGVALHYGLLQADQLDAFAAYRPDVGAHIARRRLEAGERCFVAWSGPRIVSARWIVTGSARVPEFRLCLPLADDAVFIYDSYTSPDMRSRRIASATSTRAAAMLAAEGRRQSFITVLPENGAGIRNATRSGYREIARFAVLVLGPLPAIRVPYVGRSRR
jgi:GNAT superfamily N-acetyltransferase